MADETFVDKVRGVFARFFTGTPAEDPKSTEVRYGDPALGFSSLIRQWRDLYSGLISGAGTRADKYDQYLYLDRNLAEAAAALSVYSDNLVSGTVGGDDSYYVYIDEDEKGIEALEEIIENVEKQTEIKDMFWEVARNLVRDGDVFHEVVVVEEDGEMFISHLKNLPTKEMVAIVDERGNWKDPEKPYGQVVSGSTKPIVFDWWRVIHWKIGNDIYGVDKSLFANAALRIGRQLVWVDEALVLARLSRAWQRFAYMIDTGKLGPDDALIFVDKFMKRLSSRRTVADKTTGRTTLLDAPLLPDEDIGIPVGEGAKADVKPLGGDTNVGNIRDIEYLQNKFLMAVTVPKAYVSLEEGTRAKATLGQIDVQFARQVRRRQQAMIPGLREFYELAFILAGVDPDSFGWSIEFPELATSDEMIKWELLELKAKIARALVVDVGAVNTLYIYKELLDFDDEEIQKYAAILPPEEGEESIQVPPGLADAIRRDPEARAILHDLRDLVAIRSEREATMTGRRRVGI